MKLPSGYLDNWKSPHELKDGGDVDDTIYRDIFRRGDIWIELLPQDKYGKSENVIFYVKDPDQLRADYESEGSIIVSENANLLSMRK